MILATFTLAELRGNTIEVGGLTLSNFRNDASTIDANQIFVDTIEGSDLGLRIRVADGVGTTARETESIGIGFELVAPAFILEGASMSLDGFGFGTADAGGRTEVSLSQRRAVPNIGIDLVLDNAPGGLDLDRGADIINRGPVQRFKFEYDLTTDPANNVPATIGRTTLLFDLVGDDNGLPQGFDGLQYIASYADLAAAFGANRVAGEQHFLSNGQAEGRQADLFSETQYLKNYGDLQGAFGTDVNAATSHFITNGLAEGRVDDAPSPAQIDGLQYIASNPDLIAAFGANAAAGQQHYVANGQAEGRVLDNFNETQYVANYADLQGAFGANTEAATAHYISNGFAEGRDDFLL